MKKYLLIICALILVNSTIVSAAPVPMEIVPANATADEIAVAENLAYDIFDNVQNGMGYADARNEANSRIFQAVINHQEGGYGYSILSTITSNAILYYRDLYLRPQFYAENTAKIQALIADIIDDYHNAKLDYKTAENAAYTRIYQQANPSYNPAVDRVGVFCYWNVPPVDEALLTIARKLLIYN